MEWLRTNSSEILFSSSVDSCSPPPLITITDDEGEDSASQVNVISISSSDDMEATVSGLDRIRDRAEAMTNENTFYKALEVASVQFACGQHGHARLAVAIDRCHRNVWEHDMASPSDRLG